ncbi:hypothetical protein [Azohydromonas caseinilytica]|uniref:Uncharacterized protein n=1 Tax=Azohydromonas caseinilytica TaxID=2728836 RepID=A0A848FFK1_9BURK|nr:hypothetical protein [Azohydromonas caseinilytica]NML17033.1 hypothetical protein [Azohydromonas caseinilytica]
MPSPLQTTNDDIKLLKDSQLVELLWRLVNLELSANRIEKYDSQVPLSIYIKDGGIDGLARWTDGPDKTTMLPGRIVGFQAKATDMSEAACSSEVRNKDGTLKPQVRKLVECGGAYVLFLGRDCVGQSKDPRITALKEAITSASEVAEGEKLTPGDVYIYDATDIAGWVNTYPAAVAAVFEYLGKPGAGALTWSELSGYPSFEVPFADAEKARVEIVKSLRVAATEERSITRLTGASGLGKSRLVFEAFRPPTDPAANPEQARLSSRFCYLNAARTSDIEGIVRAWRRVNCIGTIVVDDCPLELHEFLAEEARRADSRLALITIGNDLDSSAYAGTPTRLVRLEPASTDLIQGLLDIAFKDLTPDDRRFIANELAQGYPLMAIRTAEARADKAPLSARLTPQVLAKLLGRHVEVASRAAKVIAACALFENIGFDGDTTPEREFVRSIFCPEVSTDDFYAELVEFQKSGAVTKYGRLIQVRPRPLAIRLAADWWEKCPPERAAEIVALPFPPALADAFCERIRMLDFVPALSGLTEKLCGRTGPFGQAKVLSSDLGSQLFRAIAEVNPVHAVAALDYAFGDWKTDDLRTLSGTPRRNLVWALEKLAFREVSFPRAARFLFKLACAENETWSNNATGVLTRLFMVLLSGTQVPLDLRFPLLRQMGRNEEIDARRIAILALDKALTTDNFSGMSGPEYQGSSGPLPQYRPKTWKEIFEYWRNCLEELVRLAKEPGDIGEHAVAIIAAHIRGLVQHGRLDDVEWALGDVISDLRAQGKVWVQAVDAVKDVLKYDLDGTPVGTEPRVQSWLQILAPADIPQRLKLLITEPPFEHTESSDGSWIDVAAREAEALGQDFGRNWETVVSHLDLVLQGEQRQAYAFGQGLARGSRMAQALYAVILSRLTDIPFERRNSALLSGWLSVVAEHDATSCDALFTALAESPALRQSLPSIARGVGLNNNRTAVLQGLVEAGHIEVNLLYGLSNGQAMAGVSVEQISKLNRALLQKGIDGAWIALDILFIYSHGQPETVEALHPDFSAILSTRGMLSSGRAQRDAHEFEVAASRLIPQSAEIAQVLTQELCLSVTGETRISDHLVEKLFRSLFEQQPEVSWPIVRQALTQSGNIARWKLGEALRARRAGGDKSGAIDNLDLRFLKEWCNDDLALAPTLIARIVKAIEKDEADVWHLSVAAMMLINDYSNVDGVLDSLGANLHTFFWSGSLVPFYDRLISVVTPLLDHDHERVRVWAQHIIDEAIQSRTRESLKDEEKRAGRW